MKEIFYNDNQLTKEEIDESVVRVKAIILNSRDEILMGYCDGSYMFPGGHLEDGESLEEGLCRELLEETGMNLQINNDPFLLIRYYTKNYRNKGVNRENIIYYYLIKTDLEPVVNNMSLDAYEKEHNYTLKRVKMLALEDELDRTIMNNFINGLLYKEIKLVIKEINNKFYK